MSRPSKGGFADFFPAAPSVLQQKRSRPSPYPSSASPPVGDRDRDRARQGTPERTPTGPRRDRDSRPSGSRRDGSNAGVASSRTAGEAGEKHNGDMLQVHGSASSISTASSVFSTRHHNADLSRRNNTTSSTPLTNGGHSPAPKSLPPRSERTSSSTPQNHMSIRPRSRHESTPQPAEKRRLARPGPGEPRGFKVIYDPDLDPEVRKNPGERKKRKIEYQPVAQKDGEKTQDPRLRDLRAYTEGRLNRPSRKLRDGARDHAYTIKPYAYHASTSIGPGPPTRIVITGYDSIVPTGNIQALFSGFGEIRTLENVLNPNTGAYLGVCLIQYKDGKPSRGGSGVSAVDAAKRAYNECKRGLHRVGLSLVKVELDRDNSVGSRVVESAIAKEQPMLMPSAPPAEAKSPSTPATPAPTAVPSEAPKAPRGPSGKAPPTGPRIPPTGPAAGADGPIERLVLKPSQALATLVETRPILETIKRDPYILISCKDVPVMGTTIPHLKKRLRMYSWKDIRCDESGYYIIFDDSRAGELEAVRCHKSCNDEPLFTYKMVMDCQQYGNPAYERSPSPDRVLAEQARAAQREKLQKEAELDAAEERKLRAQNLDPVKEAVNTLRLQLKEKLLEDAKAKIVGPRLFELLNPDNHKDKRRRLGIEDPNEVKQKAQGMRLGAFGEEGDSLRPEVLRISALPRIRKGEGERRGFAYFDERRRARAPKRAAVRGLHARLHHQSDDESDDDRKTHGTRDSEEPGSRPGSRLGTSPVQSDDEDIPISNRRKLRRPAPAWGGDTEDEEESVEHGRVETPALPTDEMDTLDSRKRKLQGRDLTPRKRLKDDVGVGSDEMDTRESSAMPEAGIKREQLATPEVPDQIMEDAPIEGTKKTKGKKKSKKQIFEEREALKKKQQMLDEFYAEQTPVEEILPTPEEPKPEPVIIEPEPVTDVIWGASSDEPKSTVADDLDLVFDIDGWQHTLKDNEDYRLLQQVLSGQHDAPLGSAALWTYRQKQVKSLNRNGEKGVVHAATLIEGYYVPNVTGCARTEGRKEITQPEKSKYLPHRIKVQKAREEREAQARENPAAAAAEAAKIAAANVTAKASSRSHRANNRRLIADITAQRQVLTSTNSSDADALRFNQLKKRKKPVKFARSAIHNWGLYTMENIAINDMIIEYVGEKVRQQVADMRERHYLKSGIGSSYLFRIDEQTVIDATKKGGIARFINHSCMPNCTAKIIKVDGTKRIVIYALRDIAQNEELTYDYKFEREERDEDRVPCLCGTVECKGFLN